MSVNVPDFFEDPDFPLNKSTLNPKKLGLKTEFEWIRVPTFAKRLKKSSTLIPSEPMENHDVFQRQVPNCWLIPGLSKLSQYQKILEMVVPLDQSYEFYNGKVHFNLWNFGKWTEIIVDDRIPVIHHDEHLGARSSNPEVFWPPLLEKAFAKYCKSYTGGILPGDAMTMLTGGICEDIELKDKNVNEIIDYFEEAKKQNSMVFASTDNAGYGIVQDHCYSVIKTLKATIQSGPWKGSHDLIVLKNPHDPNFGSCREERGYKGPWSKSSLEWKNAPKDVRSEIESDLGPNEFCMSIKMFKKLFSEIYICHMDKSTLDSGGLNFHQVGGICKIKKQGIIRTFLKKNDLNIHNNPRFKLKIYGKKSELVELIIGLMVDPSKFRIAQYDNRKIKFDGFISKWGFKKLIDAIEWFQETLRKKSLGLWIYPIGEDNSVQSYYFKHYVDTVPKIGPTKI